MGEYKIIDVNNRVSSSFNNLTGEVFGRLEVLGLSPRKSGRKSYWVAECECGNKHVVRSDSLTGGLVRSCGCLKLEQDRINLEVNHRHKESKSRLHNTWLKMKGRCNNPTDGSYERYGGRGISVCKEWDKSYETFRDWALENGYQENLSIERIDNNGDYEPNNCEWIELREQANNRRNTIWIEWDGKTKNLMQWSKELGINYSTLHSRYNRYKKRPPELFRPVNKRRHRGK